MSIQQPVSILTATYMPNRRAQSIHLVTEENNLAASILIMEQLISNLLKKRRDSENQDTAYQVRYQQGPKHTCELILTTDPELLDRVVIWTTSVYASSIKNYLRVWKVKMLIKYTWESILDMNLDNWHMSLFGRQDISEENSHIGVCEYCGSFMLRKSKNKQYCSQQCIADHRKVKIEAEGYR